MPSPNSVCASIFTSEVASLILVPWKSNQVTAAGGWLPWAWQWKVEAESAESGPVWEGKIVTSSGGTANMEAVLHMMEQTCDRCETWK